MRNKKKALVTDEKSFMPKNDDARFSWRKYTTWTFRFGCSYMAFSLCFFSFLVFVQQDKCFIHVIVSNVHDRKFNQKTMWFNAYSYRIGILVTVRPLKWHWNSVCRKFWNGRILLEKKKYRVDNWFGPVCSKHKIRLNIRGENQNVSDFRDFVFSLCTRNTNILTKNRTKESCSLRWCIVM